MMLHEYSVSFEGETQKALAIGLAKRLNVPIKAHGLLHLTSEKLVLQIPPFSPLACHFSRAYWQKRKQQGKSQGLIRACKPKPGMKIIDATAGWGKDAAILAAFGAEVLMLERNPIMSELLNDALRRCQNEPNPLLLNFIQQDAMSYLETLPKSHYPDLIYIDPMHPTRDKTALVKKPLQMLQQFIKPDEDAYPLLQLARCRCLKKVVLKWPMQASPLGSPDASIKGKTVRFDCFLPIIPK